MKFDRGPTWKEKCAARKEWHRWFALFPRRVGSHDCRWCEYIERKGETYMGWIAPSPVEVEKWRYEYRAISETETKRPDE